MQATVIRMDGQMKQAGDQPLTEAIREGLTEGLSRAEMRETIERQAREIGELRRRLEATGAAYKREARARINADIECRVKTRALAELRRGMYGRWSQLLQMTSKEHKAWDRFITIVAACTALGAIAILCMAIIVAVG